MVNKNLLNSVDVAAVSSSARLSFASHKVIVLALARFICTHHYLFSRRDLIASYVLKIRIICSKMQMEIFLAFSLGRSLSKIGYAKFSSSLAVWVSAR